MVTSPTAQCYALSVLLLLRSVAAVGLSNDMNWLTFIFYIFAYATSNFAIDWWKIILPPWSPLIWSLVMYCAFMFCGHERNGLYSPAQFKVPLFAISLFLYFGGFTVFWGILAIIDGTDAQPRPLLFCDPMSTCCVAGIELVDGLCVTVLTVTQCLGGTAWGVPVVICAILNCLLGLLASLVGLKHIMLKKAATPAGQSVP
eukprot:SAG31_NODE_2963_length_4844_cov_7.134457_1_plen_201_part_00